MNNILVNTICQTNMLADFKLGIILVAAIFFIIIIISKLVVKPKIIGQFITHLTRGVPGSYPVFGSLDYF